MKVNPVLIVFRLFGIFLNTVFCVTALFIARLKKNDLRTTQKWTQKWMKTLCRILNLKVNTIGDMPSDGSLLAPNHLSYLDIFAIGSELKTLFVSKSDAFHWPVIGSLLKFSRQISIERRNKAEVIQTNKVIENHLNSNVSVCVFLEGTSTGGDKILPFRSSLIQPAIDSASKIYPISIQWSSLDSKITISEDVAYWKDHIFFTHFLKVLGLKSLNATLSFGEPLHSANKDRKKLIKKIESRVSKQLNE